MKWESNAIDHLGIIKKQLLADCMHDIQPSRRQVIAEEVVGVVS